MTKFKVKPRTPGKRKAVKLKMYGKSVTKQSFKDDCDINLIMAKFVKTGVLDHQRTHGAEYGFASSDDFRDSMEIISKAQTMFEELPSHLRNQFDNDPAEFLDFVQDPENLAEMQEMGLATKTLNTPEPSLAKPPLKTSQQPPKEQLREELTPAVTPPAQPGGTE